MRSTTCLDPMREENGQVELTVSPIRGPSPGPATAGYRQRLMGNPGRGPSGAPRTPQKHLGRGGCGCPNTWKGPVNPNRKLPQEFLGDQKETPLPVLPNVSQNSLFPFNQIFFTSNIIFEKFQNGNVERNALRTLTHHLQYLLVCLSHIHPCTQPSVGAHSRVMTLLKKSVYLTDVTLPANQRSQ